MESHLVIGILNGDDIGHEIVPAAVDVVKAAAEKTGLKIDWRPMPIGRTALDTDGSTFPEGTCRREGPEKVPFVRSPHPDAAGAGTNRNNNPEGSPRCP